MENERTITINTTTRSFTALAVNDPYFSDLIPPLEILRDTKQVTLEGIVADIIDEEIDTYMELQRELDTLVVIVFKFRDQDTITKDVANYLDPRLTVSAEFTQERGVSTRRLRELVDSVEEDKIDVIRKLLRRDIFSSLDMVRDYRRIGVSLMYDSDERSIAGWVGVRKDENNDITFLFVKNAISTIRPIHLSRIERISRALNMPYGWEYFVPTDYGASYDARVAHTIIVGRLAAKAYYLPIVSRGRTYDMVGLTGAIKSVLNRRNKLASASVSVEDTTDLITIYIEGAFDISAMRRDMSDIREIARPLDYGGILWDDLADVTRDSTEVVFDYVRLICGRGGFNKIAQKEKWFEYLTQPTHNVVLVSLLHSYPDDVDPSLLGLSTIINDHVPDHSWGKTDILHCIQAVVEKSIARFMTRTKVNKRIRISLDPNYYPEVITIIRSEFGDYFLNRVLISLLHYLSNHENERVDRFATLIKHRLGRL